MRSSRSARSTHNRCSAVLFFHSCGNFSFSGASHATSLRQRFAEPAQQTKRKNDINHTHARLRVLVLNRPSMSLSSPWKPSMSDSALTKPQLACDRKSTGLLTLCCAGSRIRKSSSAEGTSPRICSTSRVVNDLAQTNNKYDVASVKRDR